MTRAVLIAAVSVAAICVLSAAHAGIGCPPTHDGKPLRDVGLFEGPPSDLAELMSEPGRFVVPDIPPAERATHRRYTLGCFYDRPRKDAVTVVLPWSIRVCEFPPYPQLNCHE
jgi:hypothetical protein